MTDTTSDLTLRASFGPGKNVFYDLIDTGQSGFIISLSLGEDPEVADESRGVLLLQFDPTLPLPTVLSTIFALANSDIVAASPRAKEFLDASLVDVSEETADQ